MERRDRHMDGSSGGMWFRGFGVQGRGTGVNTSRTCSSVFPTSKPNTGVTDDYTAIGRNLFKKETNLQLFAGLKVTLSTGEAGVIEGGFGQSGKFKIRVPDGLSLETKQLLASTKKKGKGVTKGDPGKEEEAKAESQPISINLQFKRYIFDPDKKMVQS